MLWFRSAAAVLVLVGCSFHLVAAQATRGFSVEGTAMYATLSGDDFLGIDDGFGFDAQGRYAWGPFSLGAGFQYTSHGVEGISENFGVTGFFAEPRYTFPSGSPSIAPYVTGRFALVRYKIESGPDEVKASGTAFGAGGGLLVRLGPTVDFDVAVSYYGVSFGDAELNGSEIPDSDSSGSSLVVRAGVSVKLGSR